MVVVVVVVNVVAVVAVVVVVYTPWRMQTTVVVVVVVVVIISSSHFTINFCLTYVIQDVVANVALPRMKQLALQRIAMLTQPNRLT